MTLREHLQQALLAAADKLGAAITLHGGQIDAAWAYNVEIQPARDDIDCLKIEKVLARAWKETGAKVWTDGQYFYLGGYPNRLYIQDLWPPGCLRSLALFAHGHGAAGSIFQDGRPVLHTPRGKAVPLRAATEEDFAF